MGSAFAGSGTGISGPAVVFDNPAAMTPDGRYVAFASYATDLTSPGTDGEANVFLRDRWLGTTTLVSTNADGTGGGNSYSDVPSISADGRYVAFESSATNLLPTPLPVP